MPRLLAALAVVIVLLGLTNPSKAAPFADKNLEAAVQAALRLPKPEFKDDDLARLSVLEVRD